MSGLAKEIKKYGENKKKNTMTESYEMQSIVEGSK